jgi:hypothetical protein
MLVYKVGMILIELDNELWMMASNHDRLVRYIG